MPEAFRSGWAGSESRPSRTKDVASGPGTGVAVGGTGCSGVGLGAKIVAWTATSVASGPPVAGAQPASRKAKRTRTNSRSFIGSPIVGGRPGPARLSGYHRPAGRASRLLGRWHLPHRPHQHG